MSELSIKQERIAELLARKGLDALLLRRASSFAWATCGASSYINTASSEGEATLVITPGKCYLVTSGVEAPRLAIEERLEEAGWEMVVHPWHAPGSTLDDLVRGLKLGADVRYPGAADLSGEVARLRSMLLPEEGERFRLLGRLCAEAMEAAVRSVRPGQTEQEIASLTLVESQRRGAQPIVALVATDERILRFRHPLPTDKRLERNAMLVLCGRKWGLVCSVTRFVHFGALPGDLRRKVEAVARVDAALLAGTRPGRTLGEVLDDGLAAYREQGYPEEWDLLHQGGIAAYEPREFLGTPGSKERVQAGQAYAWNPSITGAKSEDTVLVGDDSCEVLTEMPGWPTIEVEAGDRTWHRPVPLEIT